MVENRKIFGRKQKKWKHTENMEENGGLKSDFKANKSELNSEKIWKIQTWIVKRYGKCGRKVNNEMIWKMGRNLWNDMENIKSDSRIVKRYEKYVRKVSWIVKWYGKYGRK